MTTAWALGVLHFWFKEHGPRDWFRKDAAFDDAIRHRFLSTHAALNNEPPEATDWQNALAGIIVLDQFSRNLFRGTAAAFASDKLALALAKEALDLGFDDDLDKHQRQFFYLPFEHSEDARMQERSVMLFESLNDPELIDYARRHKAIIDRFGRFPHRNDALGRRSTAEEIAFVKTTPGF